MQLVRTSEPMPMTMMMIPSSYQTLNDLIDAPSTLNSVCKRNPLVIVDRYGSCKEALGSTTDPWRDVESLGSSNMTVSFCLPYLYHLSHTLPRIQDTMNN